MQEKHHGAQDNQQAAYEAPEALYIVLCPLFLRGRVVILWFQKWSHLLHSNEMSFLHGGKRLIQPASNLFLDYLPVPEGFEEVGHIVEVDISRAPCQRIT